MATSAYARLLKVMQKEAAKLPQGHMTIAGADENRCIEYNGITLEPDDYISLTGTVKANSEVGVYHDGEEFYVISAADIPEIPELPDIDELKNSIKQEMKSEFLNFFHPVGDYYYTSDLAFNPNTAWGGTWERLADGRVLIAADGETNGVPTYKGNEAGGEESHRLTMSEMPTHKHKPNTTSEYFVTSEESGAGAHKITPSGSGTRYVDGQPTATFHHRSSTESIGNNESHNNMQPWTAAICWHRVA